MKIRNFISKIKHFIFEKIWRYKRDVKKFTADFETVTWIENETWVWAWATCEIENTENINMGNSIESFIDYCKKEKNAVFYFHNLPYSNLMGSL